MTWISAKRLVCVLILHEHQDQHWSRPIFWSRCHELVILCLWIKHLLHENETSHWVLRNIHCDNNYSILSNMTKVVINLSWLMELCRFRKYFPTVEESIAFISWFIVQLPLWYVVICARYFYFSGTNHPHILIIKLTVVYSSL